MIRVLVVDDSPAVRTTLTRALNEDRGLTVSATASTADEALQRLATLPIDVVTSDIHMPGMDGLEFVARVMQTSRKPIIVLSSEFRKNPSLIAEALRLGAVGVLPKPYADYPLVTLIADLRRLIHQAAATPAKPGPGRAPPAAPLSTWCRLIAVGSSTGGTVAFETFASGLPAGHPPLVVAQHIPPEFAVRFAGRLQELLPSEVQVAKGGERLGPGEIYVAPGTHHLRVRRDGPRLVTELSDGPPVNHHRPSVDVLFESVAPLVGRRGIGVILTGMGADGAKGLLAMRTAGATTFAQDEASSVVFGMPRAAIELGAAQEVVPLDGLAGRVAAALSSTGK